MEPVSCPECGRKIALAKDAPDVVSFCPQCGRCLDVPGTGLPANSPELRALVPFSEPRRPRKGIVLLGTILGVLMVLGSLGNHTDAYMRPIGIGTGCVMLLCASVLARRMNWQRSAVVRAAVIRLPDDLPDEFVRLGSPAAVYAGEGTVGAALLVLLGAVFLAFGVIAAIASFKLVHPGRLVELAFIGPIAGFTASAIGVRNLLYPLNILIFPDGIAECCKQRVRVYRWQQVESVTRNPDKSMEQPSAGVCRLRTQDGEQLTWKATRVARLEPLGHLVERATLPHLLKQALDILKAGGSVRFGPLEVSSSGVAKGSNLLKWADAETVQVRKGYLRVYQRGSGWKWCNIPLSELPNGHVLIELLREHDSIDVDG